jgi:hypothetical protein
MQRNRVPNFFVIGAAKCGTTSLHFYLDQHPQISMSRVKEPCVFSQPLWWPRLETYDGLFDERAIRRGESSTSYARYPVEGDAAPRIHQAFPHAKLIYLVRDPVERIISEYIQHVDGGVERRSIDEALTDFEDPRNFYVCGSRYATQVMRYLEYFDASSLLVLEQSELREKRAETLRKVFEFLDVDPGFWSSQFRTELLRRDDFVPYGALGSRLRASVLGRVFRRLPLQRRLPISRAARRLMRPAPCPVLDEHLRAALVDYLGPEIEQLRSITGKPLTFC